MNTDKKTIIGLNLSAFLMMLGVGMIMALLPQKIIELSGAMSSVGYLASAFAISYIVLQVPIGNISDRVGIKVFLIFGYFVCFLTGLLYFVSKHQNLYFLGRLLQGAGEAPIWALAPALLSKKYSLSKGKSIGAYNASIHIGLTIGPIISILLTKYFIGNTPFLFYAAMCFIGGIITILCVEDVKGNDDKKKELFLFKNILSLVTTKESFIALMGIALYGAGYGIFLTIIPSFLITIKHYDQTFINIFFVLFYIAISISQIVIGRLSDKFGRKPFMVIGLIVAAIGLISFPRLEQPIISIMLTIGSLGLGVFYLSSMAFLNEVVPNTLKGTISGSYYLFWGIGFFFGPNIISKANETKTSMGYAFYATLLVIEAMMIIVNIRNKSINKQ